MVFHRQPGERKDFTCGRVKYFDRRGRCPADHEEQNYIQNYMWNPSNPCFVDSPYEREPTKSLTEFGERRRRRAYYARVQTTSENAAKNP